MQNMTLQDRNGEGEKCISAEKSNLLCWCERTDHRFREKEKKLVLTRVVRASFCPVRVPAASRVQSMPHPPANDPREAPGHFFLNVVCCDVVEQRCGLFVVTFLSDF
jgi:hypothetical protein